MFVLEPFEHAVHVTLHELKEAEPAETDPAVTESVPAAVRDPCSPLSWPPYFTLGGHLAARELPGKSPATGLSIQRLRVRFPSASLRFFRVLAWNIFLCTEGRYNAGMDVEINPIHRTVAENLKARRKQLGLSQRALAERIGIAHPSINRWENMLESPNLGWLEKLAENLDTTVVKLVTPGCYAEEVAA